MTNDQIAKLLFNPDTIITICQNWQKDRAKVAALTAENTELKDTVSTLTPKAEYHDAVLNCSELITITTIAKDYGMSGTAMNRLLRKLGVQYYQGGIWHLYQKYARLGWAHSQTIAYTDKNGKSRTKIYTCWTETGRRGLYDLLKSHGYYPITEKPESQEITLWF